MSPPPGFQPPGLHSRKENVWVTSEPMFKVRYELEDFLWFRKMVYLCTSLSPTSKQEDLSGEAFVERRIQKQCISDAPISDRVFIYLFISGYSLGQSYLIASIAGHESYHPMIGFSEEIMILFFARIRSTCIRYARKQLVAGFFTFAEHLRNETLSPWRIHVHAKRCFHWTLPARLRRMEFIELIAAHGKGVVLDIGANIGAFTVPLAAATKLLYPESAKVLSFEPQKRLFNMLRANVALNHLGDVVEAFNSAVGAR